MRSVRVAGIPAMAILLAIVSVSTVHASPPERTSGTVTSISDAIAARVIATKCNRPSLPNAFTPAELTELDSYIDERQTAFMLESKANQRLGEMVFPGMARDYDRLYSNPDACDAASRDRAKAMIERVHEAQSELKKQAEVRN